MDYRRLHIIDLKNGPRAGRGRRGAGALLAAALVAGAGATWAVSGTIAPDGAALAAAAPITAADRTVGSGRDSYAPIVARVTPAVVTVRSERRAGPALQTPFSDDPFLRRFFPQGPGGPSAPPERRAGGLGSGVIVTADGYVLTNHHVVAGAESITVELHDRRSLSAKVVGSDPPSDLAVLKVEASGLPALALGDSEAVQVGDVVLAVGNPMGIGQTVTMGIVSATGRATGLGDGSFEDFLQTDAPINHGNSGGALVNTRGELVGINSQILSPSGGNIGIGFAIPANMARHVMDSLISDGRVRRGRLGVTVQALTPALAESLQLREIRGALVSGVEPGGPADKAGIERGDVILSLDGTRVDNSNDLRNQVAAQKPGARASLTLVRDGKERTVSATLEELPAAAAAASPTAGGEGRDGAGLTVQPLTEDLARRLGVEIAEGLLVSAVESGSAADRAGFRQGDVISEVEGKPVTRASEMRAALSAAGERPALVLVHRGEGTLYLTLPSRTS